LAKVDAKLTAVEYQAQDKETPDCEQADNMFPSNTGNNIT
jgi:hypothetical protein